MRKTRNLLLVTLLVLAFGIFAIASGESDSKTDNQGSDSVQSQTTEENLGNYKIDIDSCRLAKDYEGKDVVIVKYIFTNNDDDPASFYMTFDDAVYQNGVGLNESYVVSDTANYSSDNQSKEIKKGASLEVEVAYELNDTVTDIEVEVTELISFSDDVVTKTFSIK